MNLVIIRVLQATVRELTMYTARKFLQYITPKLAYNFKRKLIRSLLTIQEDLKEMRISDNGIEKLIDFEGKRNKVYGDSADYATIGVGHLLRDQDGYKVIFSKNRYDGILLINGARVDYRNGLTDEEVNDLLRHDLIRFERAINLAVTVSLEQYQFDMLVSFAFNVGRGAFKSSTLLKRLNAGKYDDVPDQLRRWNKAGGKVIRGLINRREKEIVIWDNGY